MALSQQRRSPTRLPARESWPQDSALPLALEVFVHVHSAVRKWALPQGLCTAALGRLPRQRGVSSWKWPLPGRVFLFTPASSQDPSGPTGCPHPLCSSPSPVRSSQTTCHSPLDISTSSGFTPIPPCLRRQSRCPNSGSARLCLDTYWGWGVGPRLLETTAHMGT